METDHHVSGEAHSVARVLIVDDDKGVRLILKRLLADKLGCEVKEAGNGIQAMQSVRQEQFDLILLDVCMPVQGGKEFLEALRAKPEFARIAVVMISSENKRSTVMDLLKLGIMGYYLKPLDIGEMEKKLMRIISRICEAHPPAQERGRR